MFQEIHIIHHFHTDFGYTDLPSTIREQQVRYLADGCYESVTLDPNGNRIEITI
jgi:hypothetical protein